MRTFLRQLLRALTHSGPGYDLTPLPRRGDATEQWLKAQRDEYEQQSSREWRALDELLDTYRLHADTGTPLGQHVCEGGNPYDCYGCFLEQQKDGAR